MRYTVLDGYRFIAASGVLLYHYNIDFQLGLDKISPAVSHFSTFVDFFFLLSGFVIGKAYLARMSTYQDYGWFLRSRLARIYPLHFATAMMSLSLLGFAHVFHLQINHPEVLQLSGLPANLGLLHAWGGLDHPSFNVPSWSISVEWFAYLLAPLFFFLARRVPMVLNGVIIAGFVIAMVILRQQAELGPWYNATYDFGVFRGVPTFFAGILIAHSLYLRQFRWPVPWWVAHVLFAVALAGLHANIQREWVICLFGLFIGAAMLAQESGGPSLMGGEVMVRLGDISYAVYLLHTLVSLPFLLLARKLGLIGTSGAFMCAIVAATITVALSFLVHARFEVPFQKRIGGIKKYHDPTHTVARGPLPSGTQQT